MNLMQQRIENRLTVMTKLAPGEPMPEAKARMTFFDSLPREIRHAVANSERCQSTMVQRAAIMVRAGKPVKAILKMIETESIKAAGPVARGFTALELEALGL